MKYFSLLDPICPLEVLIPCLCVEVAAALADPLAKVEALGVEGP